MKQFIIILFVLLPISAFAQFTESFDGPEIDTARWKGGREKFIINDEGWLQLDAPKEAGLANLNCRIPYSSTMQWEFEVLLKEIPSEQNYLRLYLYRESDDTYYYVQIGNRGKKKIGLYTNGKIALFPPIESEFTEKPIHLYVKVTLDNNNVWSMYTRQDKHSCYRLEGTTNAYPVENPSKEGLLILNIEYTKTRSKHFAMDNIKVSSEITPTDLTPKNPTLLSVEQIDEFSLSMKYDIAVNAEYASIKLSGQEADQLFQSEDYKELVPVWTNPRILGENYILDYSGIFSMDGESLESNGTKSFISTYGSAEDEPDEPEDKPVEEDSPNVPDIPKLPEDEPADEPEDATIIVEPREFVINEILPNPFVDGSEYFELYNRSDRTLPLSGLSVAVRKKDGTLNTRYPLSAIREMIEPGDYAVMTKKLSGVTDFYTIESPAALFEIPKLPILANTSSTLVLFRTTDGEIIDEVSYSSKWHAHSVKEEKGVALERIDPEDDSQLADNWTSASATAGYGTPGYENSQYGQWGKEDEEEDATGVEVPRWDASSGRYIISYAVDQPGYNCRAFVFNLSGQRVAEIANHDLLGMMGQLYWDGRGISGTSLPTGVYIFYVELYHTNGHVKQYKQVFLVQ